MEPLPRSWLAFARSCMAMVSLPRSWQDLGKASKVLGTIPADCFDEGRLGRARMASSGGRPSHTTNINFWLV